MGEADGLLRLLRKYNIEHNPDDIRDKFSILIKTLRGKRKQSGGGNEMAERATAMLGGLRLPEAPPSLSGLVARAAGTEIPPVMMDRTPGDFLGNAARWWVKAAQSPYLGALVKMTFFIMFFLSFLESTPIVGSVVSVALDATLMGGKVLIKALQKLLPSVLGLLPLPYAQLTGVVIVSVVGLFLWSILAMISFGRQDFTSAIDSMLRVIPIPVGDALADGFLELNHMADRVSVKKDQLIDDVWSGLKTIQSFTDSVSGVAPEALERVKMGTDAMMNAVQEAREEPEPPVVEPEPIPTAEPVAPEPFPVATPIPEPLPAPPEPVAPPPEPLPAPVAAPIPEPLPAPVAAPIPEPIPAPPAPAPMTALERLRSQKTSYTAPKQLRGGRKSLSTKSTKTRKWKTRRHRKFGTSSGRGFRSMTRSARSKHS